MSVHQLKDGRWVVRFPVGKLPDKPKASCEYFGRGVTAEARALERNRELGLGNRLEATGRTFTDAALYYIEAKDDHIEQKSIATAMMHLHSHLIKHFGTQPCTSITEEQVDAYVRLRRSGKWRNGGGNGREKTGVTKSTIKRELTTFQAVLNFAARRKLIVFNPVLHYQMPKEDDAVIAPASVSEIDAILKVAPPHLQRFIILAYYTACRPGYTELLTMRWDQVDLAGKTLFIKSARKGGLVQRRISIHPQLLEHLERWLEEDKEPGYIVHYQGKHIKKVDKAWANAKKKAKILRRLRTYDIRHASITSMLENGGDLKAVSMAAGHRSPAMTMAKYQHVSTRLQEQAITGLSPLGTSGTYGNEQKEEKR